MAAKLAASLPEGPDWLYEIKFDGFRAQAINRNGLIELLSRNRKSFRGHYPEILDALKNLPGKNWGLDGELVAINSQGKQVFQALGSPKNQKGLVICYYVFDLLNLEGKSLLNLPLEGRRQLLRDWIAGSSELIRYSDELKAHPAELISAVREQGLEGIIAKRRKSQYEPGGRKGAWLKYKTGNEQEFVIGGYRRAGKTFDALIVGFYEKGKLRYAAKVLAGLNPHSKRAIIDLARPLQTNESPFFELPIGKGGRWGEGVTDEDLRHITWLKPVLVAQITFVEWTSKGNLRHPAFKGLRPDKSAEDVSREIPLKSEG